MCIRDILTNQIKNTGVIRYSRNFFVLQRSTLYTYSMGGKGVAAGRAQLRLLGVLDQSSGWHFDAKHASAKQWLMQ